MARSSSKNPSKIKAIAIAVASNFIEYYDYAVYGFFAASLATSFFPEESTTSALTKSWSIFLLGSLAKSLGAYVFGRFGDARGRKWSLRWNILGIGITTLLISVLPDYQTLSIWAPILLLTLRLLQGFFYGGEVDGIRIYVLEHVGNKGPCFANSLSSLSSSLGVAMAGWISAFSFLSAFNTDSWRIAFALGGLGALLIFAFRTFLPETNSFKKAQKTAQKHQKTTSNESFFDHLRAHFSIFIAIILLSACVSGSYYFLMLFGPTLWGKLLMVFSYNEAKILTNHALWIYTLLLPIAGLIADRVTPKKTFTISLILLLMLSSWFFVFPIKMLLQNHIITGIGICLSFLNVSTYVLIVQRIPVLSRYQLIAVSHALGSSLLAVPLIGTLIWQETHNFFWLGVYLFALLSAGLIALSLMNSIKPRAI